MPKVNIERDIRGFIDEVAVIRNEAADDIAKYLNKKCKQPGGIGFRTSVLVSALYCERLTNPVEKVNGWLMQLGFEKLSVRSRIDSMFMYCFMKPGISVGERIDLFYDIFEKNKSAAAADFKEINTIGELVEGLKAGSVEGRERTFETHRFADSVIEKLKKAAQDSTYEDFWEKIKTDTDSRDYRASLESFTRSATYYFRKMLYLNMMKGLYYICDRHGELTSSDDGESALRSLNKSASSASEHFNRYIKIQNFYITNDSKLNDKTVREILRKIVKNPCIICNGDGSIPKPGCEAYCKKHEMLYKIAFEWYKKDGKNTTLEVDHNKIRVEDIKINYRLLAEDFFNTVCFFGDADLYNAFAKLTEYYRKPVFQIKIDDLYEIFSATDLRNGYLEKVSKNDEFNLYNILSSFKEYRERFAIYKKRHRQNNDTMGVCMDESPEAVWNLINIYLDKISPLQNKKTAALIFAYGEFGGDVSVIKSVTQLFPHEEELLRFGIMPGPKTRAKLADKYNSLKRIFAEEYLYSFFAADDGGMKPSNLIKGRATIMKNYISGKSDVDRTTFILFALYCGLDLEGINHNLFGAGFATLDESRSFDECIIKIISSNLINEFRLRKLDLDYIERSGKTEEARDDEYLTNADEVFTGRNYAALAYDEAYRKMNTYIKNIMIDLQHSEDLIDMFLQEKIDNTDALSAQQLTKFKSHRNKGIKKS